MSYRVMEKMFSAVGELIVITASSATPPPRLPPLVIWTWLSWSPSEALPVLKRLSRIWVRLRVSSSLVKSVMMSWLSSLPFS